MLRNLTHSLEEKPDKAVALVASEGVEAYLPLAGLVDLEQVEPEDQAQVGV